MQHVQHHTQRKPACASTPAHTHARRPRSPSQVGLICCLSRSSIAQGTIALGTAANQLARCPRAAMEVQLKRACSKRASRKCLRQLLQLGRQQPQQGQLQQQGQQLQLQARDQACCEMLVNITRLVIPEVCMFVGRRPSSVCATLLLVAQALGQG